MRYVGTSSPDIDGLYFRTANDALNSYSDKMVILGQAGGHRNFGPQSTFGNSRRYSSIKNYTQIIPVLPQILK